MRPLVEAASPEAAAGSQTAGRSSRSENGQVAGSLVITTMTVPMTILAVIILQAA
jgi:hypothetical protein